jgi:hypothetical protein
MEFYNTFKTQFELLPRLSMVKGNQMMKLKLHTMDLPLSGYGSGVFVNVC